MRKGNPNYLYLYIFLYRRIGSELTATNQNPGVVILSPMKTYSMLTCNLISMKCLKVLGMEQEQTKPTTEYVFMANLHFEY